MSCRRWRPGAWIRSAAESAAVAASARLGPRPTTERTRPPAVRNAPSVSRTVPEWKTSAPLATASSSPSIRSPDARRFGIARGGQDDRDRRAREERKTPTRKPGRSERRREVAARRGQQDRTEGDGKPRQDGLCLGVAEARVALEQDRAIRREHQTRVERATERGAAPGQLGQDRAVEEPKQVLPGLIGQLRERAVGTHPAGVRATVSVEQSLVIAGHRKRDSRRAVADGDQARLAADQTLLDDDPVAVRRMRPPRPRRAPRSPVPPPRACRTPSRPCRPSGHPP